MRAVRSSAPIATCTRRFIRFTGRFPASSTTWGRRSSTRTRCTSRPMRRLTPCSAACSTRSKRGEAAMAPPTHSDSDRHDQYSEYLAENNFKDNPRLTENVDRLSAWLEFLLHPETHDRDREVFGPFEP